jgi:hypothetical protein
VKLPQHKPAGAWIQYTANGFHAALKNKRSAPFSQPLKRRSNGVHAHMRVGSNIFGRSITGLKAKSGNGRVQKRPHSKPPDIRQVFLRPEIKNQVFSRGIKRKVFKPDPTGWKRDGCEPPCDTPLPFACVDMKRPQAGRRIILPHYPAVSRHIESILFRNVLRFYGILPRNRKTVQLGPGKSRVAQI